MNAQAFLSNIMSTQDWLRLIISLAPELSEQHILVNEHVALMGFAANDVAPGETRVLKCRATSEFKPVVLWVGSENEWFIHGVDDDWPVVKASELVIPEQVVSAGVDSIFRVSHKMDAPASFRALLFGMPLK